jgi:predicted nucleotidyltransferase component of viral defense system
LSKSGSRKKAARSPELHPWQERALDVVAASSLAPELVFGGGAALAAVHLHHRTSEDLDFFFMRPVEPEEAEAVGRALVTKATRVDVDVVGARTSLVLRRKAGPIGRIDFAYYPYDPIGRRPRWRGLVVESTIDMAVNKVQAILTRRQPRDYVDLYFLLQEGPERSLERLLSFVRAKFDVGAHPTGLAQRLLLVREMHELPRMIRPVTHAELVAFFEDRVRAIVRSE